MRESDPCSNGGYKSPPPEALRIYERLSMSPRLLAHLVLVHDTACKLVERVKFAFPGVELDDDLVRFGAAIHDVGKTIHRDELTESGKKQHLKAGVETLESLGVPHHSARFALTHANWSGEEITLEDLLVALADKCWKGKRIEALELRTAETLSAATGRPAWECYARLDETLQELAEDAESRLAFQASFPV